MQQIEIGKLSGSAPLDFIANMVLWMDQLAIILDDAATCYNPPRILHIGKCSLICENILLWLIENSLIFKIRRFYEIPLN